MSNEQPPIRRARAREHKSNIAYMVEALPKPKLQRATAIAFAGVLAVTGGTAATAFAANTNASDAVRVSNSVSNSTSTSSSSSASVVSSVTAKTETSMSFTQVEAKSTPAPGSQNTPVDSSAQQPPSANQSAPAPDVNKKPDTANGSGNNGAAANKPQPNNNTGKANDAKPVAVNDPARAQEFARSKLSSYGWGDDQWGCLQKLWTRESSWQTTAENPSSGAYGIAQSLPASKMSSVGNDWRTNYQTQITWGLGYIKQRYGSPCNAWGHSEATGWY